MPGAPPPAAPSPEAALQSRVVDAERASIAELYAAGALDDEARRRIERELDLEEASLAFRREGESETPL